MTINETTETPTVVQALNQVMAEVQAVRKSDRNQQQGFNFRGVDAVVNAVGPAMRKHGVVVTPIAETVNYQVVEVGKQKTLMRECTLRMRFAFHGPAGDKIEAVTYGEALDSGDKATPKAHSVAYRTALLQALCIPTDEADPDAEAHERSGRERAEATGHGNGHQPPPDPEADAAPPQYNPSDPSHLRGQIGVLAKQQGIPIGTVEKHFAEVNNGASIRTAEAGPLAAYLEQMQQNGQTAEAS